MEQPNVSQKHILGCRVSTFNTEDVLEWKHSHKEIFREYFEKHNLANIKPTTRNYRQFLKPLATLLGLMDHEHDVTDEGVHVMDLVYGKIHKRLHRMHYQPHRAPRSRKHRVIKTSSTDDQYPLPPFRHSGSSGLFGPVQDAAITPSQHPDHSMMTICGLSPSHGSFSPYSARSFESHASRGHQLGSSPLAPSPSTDSLLAFPDHYDETNDFYQHALREAFDYSQPHYFSEQHNTCNEPWGIESTCFTPSIYSDPADPQLPVRDLDTWDSHSPTLSFSSMAQAQPEGTEHNLAFDHLLDCNSHLATSTADVLPLLQVDPAVLQLLLSKPFSCSYEPMASTVGLAPEINYPNTYFEETESDAVVVANSETTFSPLANFGVDDFLDNISQPHTSTNDSINQTLLCKEFVPTINENMLWNEFDHTVGQNMLWDEFDVNPMVGNNDLIFLSRTVPPTDRGATEARISP